MVQKKRINFGSLQQAQETTIKPLDKFATLEKLDHYLIYTKRYSKVNVKAVMQVANYLLNHFNLSKIDLDLAQTIEEDLRAKGLKSRTIIRKLHCLELISEALGCPIKVKKAENRQRSEKRLNAFRM